MLLITSHLEVASGLPLAIEFATVPMYKLQRVVESGTVTLIVIGRMDAEQLPDLQTSSAPEPLATLASI